MPSTPTAVLIERVEAHIRPVARRNLPRGASSPTLCEFGARRSDASDAFGSDVFGSDALLGGLEEYYGNVNMLLVEAWLGFWV